MTLQDFITIIQKSGLMSESFGSKDIGPLFNISMQTYVDELALEKHMKMTLIEFVEASARVAD